MMERRRKPLVATSLLLALLLALAGCTQLQDTPLVSAGESSNTYRNPLEPRIPEDAPGDGIVESCADPTVIYGQEGEGAWYMYCTTDPLNDEDKGANGSFNFRLIPMFKSSDLVNWTYEGEAFAARPAYATSTAGIWAPEIQYYSQTGEYHLYYVVTDTALPGGGSAIGVATSDTPLGPWTHQNTPVVEPHPADCCPGSRRWVFDPEVLQTDGEDYIYYGSYFGGVSVRELAEDGFSSDPGTQEAVTIANRYEGPEVVFKDGYYYLFVSATDCCRGPLTGYSVFAGRSRSPTGPFVDREGVSLLEGRVGGTPVLSMNGNRWVGLGHNTVFEDFSGQWWTIYHAVDRFDPYFEGAVGFTKRPALLDALDWVDGWPTVRVGRWASDTPQAAPAAQPGERTTYKPRPSLPDRLGKLVAQSDFSGDRLDAAWTWVREPDSGTYELSGGALRWDTQAADLFVASNNASVLTRPAPHGNYAVEARVKLDLPPEGCCYNYTQAGLVIYGGDDNFIKLVHVSIWETRQTEFAKEEVPVPAGYPRYGNTVVGPPHEWTLLRIVKRTVGGEEHYTAYTKRDVSGAQWVRGGTWTHDLGKDARLGLVSMGGSGFTAEFDYVRVYRVDRGH